MILRSGGSARSSLHHRLPSFAPPGLFHEPKLEKLSMNHQTARLNLDEKKITVIPNKTTATTTRHQASRACGA